MTMPSTKRSRAKSALPAALNQTVLLRVEPRLKWSGSIDLVPVQGGGWTAQVQASDGKLREDFERRNLFQASESACLIEACNALEAWLTDLQDRHITHRVRLSEVLDQLRAHRRQLICEGIPETQGQAAAKESAAIRLPPGDRPAWRCACGRVNDWSLPLCACGKTLDVVDEAANLSPLDPLPLAAQDIAIERVHPHPRNPRAQLTGIEELARSLAADGQLVECLGRRRPDGEIELLGGHRRLAAAKVAGLKMLRVRVIEVTEAQAIELLGKDNEERENFDAIARGRWYQMMLDSRDWSQRQLAAHLGVSQADVANYTRLLKLPEVWQQRIIAGEITATMARALAPWADRPSILQEMEEVLRENQGEEWTTQQWAGAVRTAIRDLTLPCVPGAWYSGNFGSGKTRTWRSGHCRLTAEEIDRWRDELDVVEVPAAYGRDEMELRAFNLKRWLELNGNAVKRHEEQQTKKGAKSPPKIGQQARRTSAAEVQQREEEARRQLAERIRKYKIRWLQSRIGEVLATRESPTEADVVVSLQLLLYFAVQPSHARSAELKPAIIAAGGKIKEQTLHWDEWASLASLKSRERLWDCIDRVLRSWLAHDVSERSRDLKQADVAPIAEALGIRFAKEWRVDEAFLRLHTQEQLSDLAAEWKLANSPAVDAAGTKQELIDALLTCDQRKRLPLPQCLR